MKDLNYYMSLNYDIKIHKFDEEEGGGYQASIPLLGEATFVAIDDTVEGAIAKLEDVKKDIFTILLKQGKKIKEPEKEQENNYSGKFIIRVPIELHKKLAEEAEEQGMSLNSYIIYLLSSNFSFDIMKDYFNNVQTSFDEMLANYRMKDFNQHKSIIKFQDRQYSWGA